MSCKLITLWITKWVGHYYTAADLSRPRSPLAWRQRWPIHSASTVKSVEAAQYFQSFVKCSRFIRKDRYVDEWVFRFFTDKPIDVQPLLEGNILFGNSIVPEPSIGDVQTRLSDGSEVLRMRSLVNERTVHYAKG